MMVDIFGANLPHIVNGAFAASYVFMISVFNMIGRVFWASTSDYIGRRNAYFVFFGLGIPLYCSIPFCAQWASSDPSVAPLVVFYGASMLIFTMYGGGFATIPAYLADMFGTKYVGGIHGRLLTAWSTAGIAGPLLLTHLRTDSVRTAITDLSMKVDVTQFEARFGAPVSQLDSLVEAKTVTIARLMELCPPGVIDPTPGLYNSTMYCMAGLLGVAFISNTMIRPVHPKHHLVPAQSTVAPIQPAVAQPAVAHPTLAQSAQPLVPRFSLSTTGPRYLTKRTPGDSKRNPGDSSSKTAVEDCKKS
jgi:hypothetical protein